MGTRILVVEDNPSSLRLMTYLLGKAGHALSTAVNGAAGLEVVRRERPDLVLMDLQMPELDGYEVARAVRADPELRHTPLVAVTAVAMVGDRERVLAAGFDGYITKPIAPETFVDQVIAFLDLGRRQPGPSALATGERAKRPPSPARVFPRASTPATVLVVDDLPENLAFARAALEAAGLGVTTARTVGEGMRLAEGRPALVLSDLHLPDGTGWDLLEWVRADPRLADIPVALISSAVLTEADRHRARQAGAVQVIARPVEADELAQQVLALLPAAAASG